MKNATQILYKHIGTKVFDMSDPVIDAMQEYAAQEAEKARQEERERHRKLAYCAVLLLQFDYRHGGDALREALKEAGYEIKEEEQ